MGRTNQKILERLEPVQGPEKKQFSLALPVELVEKLDMVARAMAKASGRSVTRNMLIEDAVEAFLDEAVSTLEERGIVLEEAEQPDFYDTVVLSGYEDRFRQAFLTEECWYPAKVSQERIPRIRYVAIYVGQPVSAVTHYGKVREFVPDGARKYRIELEGAPVPLAAPIPLGDIAHVLVCRPRYTTLDRLLAAKEYKDLL